MNNNYEAGIKNVCLLNFKVYCHDKVPRSVDQGFAKKRQWTNFNCPHVQ